MQASQIPAKVPLPWASSATAPYIRAIPTASQIGIQNGAASFADGFPPWCFQPGGFPFGSDMNGILNQETAWSQWQAAGAPIYFDATYASTIGGYPQYALIASSSKPGAWWQSQVDNNTTNPDLGGANWVLCTMQQPYLDARYLRLPPATTFYVNISGGSDTLYDGTSATVIAGTSHGPWASVTHAILTLSGTYAFTGQILIYVAAGTYLGGVTVPPSSIGSWFIAGAGAPGNPYATGTTVFSNTPAGGIAFQTISSNVTVTNVSATSASQCFLANVSSTLRLYNVSVFGVGSGAQGFAAFYGSSVILNNNTGSGTNTVTYGVSGSLSSVFFAGQNGSILLGFTNGVSTSNAAITFGATNCAAAVAQATEGGTILFTVGAISFAGTPTATRYLCAFGGGVACIGGGINFIPGTAAGIAASSTTITTSLGTQAGWYAA